MANSNLGDLSSLFGSMNTDAKSPEKTAKEMMSGLNKDQSDELQKILSDKEKINEILASPVAQKLMKKMNGKNNGQHK